MWGYFHQHPVSSLPPSVLLRCWSFSHPVLLLLIQGSIKDPLESIRWPEALEPSTVEHWPHFTGGKSPLWFHFLLYCYRGSPQSSPSTLLPDGLEITS